MTARKRPAVVWLVEWRDGGDVAPDWRPFLHHAHRTRALAEEECRYQRGGASGCEYRAAKYVREEK